MDAKQKKIALICAGVFFGSYAFKTVGNAVASMIIRHQQAEMAERQQAILAARKKAVEAKKAQEAPTAVISAPVVAPPPAPEVAPPDPIFVKLRGRYLGTGALAGRGICTLHFDFNSKPAEPARFTGAFSLTCNPNNPVNARKRNAASDARSRMDPEAATLSGVPENGILKLDTEAVIGKSVQGCAVSSAIVTPFGVSGIDVAWAEELPCQGDHIILRKIG